MNFYRNDHIPTHLKRFFQNAPDRSIWGGDPTCDHQWGALEPPHHPGQVEQTKWQEATAAGAGGVAAGGQYCQKCNAWLGQLGLEPTPDEFVLHLVEIFREVKRVLRDDGTLWLNLGDSYANQGIQASAITSTGGFTGERIRAGQKGIMGSVKRAIPMGMKPKDLIGIPWMAAFALRADGWYLRSDIVWQKANCMPESVTDRPTRSHEYVFLLAKSPHYFYDVDAIREPHDLSYVQGRKTFNSARSEHCRPDGRTDMAMKYDGVPMGNPAGRNKRSVWTLANDSNMWRLRTDLTPAERRYVLDELLARGLL